MKIRAKFLKKAISLIMSVALLLTLCLTTASPMLTATAAGGNLITNGDAEDGTITGWNCATAGAISNINNADTELGEDPAKVATAHAGLTTAGSRFFYCWNSKIITQQLALKPNTEYVFSAFFYSAAGSTKASASILDGDTVIQSYTIKDDYKWVSHTFMFTTADNGNVTLSINTGKYNYFAFDNVTLYEIGYLGAVKNGDAECGVTTGWSKTKSEAASFQVFNNSDSTDVSVAHKSNAIGGEKYFYSWGYNHLTQTLNLKANTVYIISFDFYATNGNVSTTVNDGVSDIYTVAVANSATNAWKSFNGYFQTNDATSYTFKLSAGWGNLYFDNVSVVEVTMNGAVKNGDAEIGSTYGWSETKNQTGSFQVITNTDTSAASVAHKDNAIGGDKYFYSWSYNHLTQTVNLKANTAYMISFDYYATNGNVSTSVNDGAADIYTAAVAGSATNAWKSFKGYFDTNTATSYTFKLSTGWGNLYFDNVSIVEIPKNGVVTNGNFDFGTYGWNTNSGANIVSVGDRNVLNIWQNKTVTQAVTLKANTAYKLSFDERHEGTTYCDEETCQLYVNITAGETVYIDESMRSGYWNTRDFVFVTTEDTDAVLSFKSQGDNYYITNISIEECADMFVNGIANVSNMVASGTAEQTNAIRFTTAIYDTEYTVNEVGMLFAAGKNIPEELTKDMLTRTSMVKGGAVNMDAVISAGAADVYTVLVDNIDAAHHNTDIAARMYLVCTDSNGEEVIVYGETVVVSVNG